MAGETFTFTKATLLVSKTLGRFVPKVFAAKLGHLFGYKGTSHGYTYEEALGMLSSTHPDKDWHEDYWDAWEAIVDAAHLLEDPSVFLHHDGDLFAVPESDVDAMREFGLLNRNSDGSEVKIPKPEENKRKSRITQRERLLRYALWQGELGFTRLDVVQEVGVFELAARIGELEKAGHRFKRKRETVATRWGGNVRVTRYTYEGQPEVVA